MVCTRTPLRHGESPPLPGQEPHLGGQAQFFKPYCPQRSAAHLPHGGQGLKAERFAGAQWEKPFSFAKAISRSIGTLPS